MAKAGKAPWSQGYKPLGKVEKALKGIDWSLSSGYRQKKHWFEKPKKPKMKQVHLYDGSVAWVPDADFEDFIGHHATPTSDPNTEVGKFIDEAFSDMDKVLDTDGVGHISYIEYVPTHQILRVEFANDGAVVVFFRVPKEVYSELKYLADSKQTAISPVDGTQRHVLGMRFWDIIRIRGQREGGRYRYEYAIEGERTGSVFSKQMAATRQDSDVELYDKYAKNMLTGKQKTEYDKLTSLEEKEAYLHKAGII